MGQELSIAVAFAAGLVSFLSPCVLPLVPGFLAYLAGSVQGQRPTRAQTFVASLFFVLGFSSIFALLGVLLNTVLSLVAYDVQLWLSRIGGVIIITFGVYLTGLVRIPLLDRPHVLRVRHRFSSRELTAFVFGAAFAAGWTPCVGAALGAILGLAASAPQTAFVFLTAYALGLGVPFLIVGLFANSANALLARFARATGFITAFFGVILIIVGVLVFTQQLARFANSEALIRLFLP